MTHSFHYLKLTLLILLFAFLQISVLPQVWLLKAKPDTLLILVFLIAMTSRSIPEIVFLSLACGLLKDIFGFHFFGLNVLMMILSALLVYAVFQILNKELKGIKFPLLFLVTLVNYLALTIIFGRPYFLSGFLEAILNCLFLPFSDIVLKNVAGDAYK